MKEFNLKQLQSEMVRPITNDEFETFEKSWLKYSDFKIDMTLNEVIDMYYKYLALANYFETSYSFEELKSNKNYIDVCNNALCLMCLWKHYNELEYCKGGEF
ncbi:MAG: hypothetical protein J6Y28_07900 [Acholeplasmatales bacterium]|nr:hypothetical protein [Acholeplasmatales bacterium]